MATASENEEMVEDTPDTFQEGLRVRVSEGEHEGVVGEIVWWGKSKFGPGMRAGVQPEDEDDDEEKIWVEASEMVAIDEEGNDLDPQPTVEHAAPLQAKKTRAIKVPFELGRVMTGLRIQRGYPESKAPSTTMRLDRLLQAEEELGCTIPDAIVAYIGSGLGTIRKVNGIEKITRKLYQQMDEDTPLQEAKFLAFDRDGDDFLVFERDAERDSEETLILQGEEDYDPESVDLMDRLGDQLEEKLAPTLPSFEVAVDIVAEDAPEPEADETWVKHSKFGRGLVLDAERTAKGQKLTIRFDGGKVVKLLDRFIEVE